MLRAVAVLVAGALCASGCSSSTPGSAAPPANEPGAPAAAAPEQGPEPYSGLPEEARGLLDQPFTGDFDAMVQRRLIRAGVVFNRTQYFIDKGVQRGISYESLRLFEEEINRRLKTGTLKVHVAIIPMSRDQLFPALQAGKVDLVAAALTITPERRALVDFSAPTRRDVSEIVVTAPGITGIDTTNDLAGREVFVRRSSSYYESLQALNQSLTAHGRPPVRVRLAPEALEDDDILEMVNAGLVDATVVDDFVVDFWRQIFTGIVPHEHAAVRAGGDIAVGVRKNSPQLLKAINAWIDAHGARTVFGNMMERRYLKDGSYVKGATAEAERRKLRALVTLFQTYGQEYDVDYLLMAAQGYQESGLDQSVRSRVGAIGVMQVMPTTARDMAVGDITKTESNVHAGVKYFRFMMDTFYRDEPMDQLNKGLMTLASYNAGPARIRQLRTEAQRRGLNPNVWFGNVERVVSERVGRETVDYVSNIFKYYVAYQLVVERDRARSRAREAVNVKAEAPTSP